MSAMNSAKIIEVIETESIWGNGQHDSPFRKVTQYWAKYGSLLATRDPFVEANKQLEAEKTGRLTS